MDQLAKKPLTVRPAQARDATSDVRGSLGLSTLALLGLVAVGPGALTQSRVGPPAVVLDSLLRTKGPTWREERSRYFVLYTERAGGRPLSSRLLLKNLEDALHHDVALLGVPLASQSPVTVLVTHTAKRFPGVLAPSSRGLMRATSGGEDLVILVQNDSIRAFTNHEVMHVVAHRAWGTPRAAWVDEGLATWADGRCQTTTVLAVARDLLRSEPGLTVEGLPARFAAGAGPLLGPRLGAYVLAASMVSFVYDRGGPAALHELWRTGVAGKADPLDDTLTRAWRDYVQRAAGSAKGLSTKALEARGCD